MNKRQEGKSTKVKKGKKHNSDDKRRSSVFVGAQDALVGNTVSSFNRSQSSVNNLLPLRHIAEEHTESELSSFQSKHHTPMSRTESAEPSQSLSGEGTPERRAMATAPAEIIQNNTIMARKKRHGTNQSS